MYTLHIEYFFVKLINSRSAERKLGMTIRQVYGLRQSHKIKNLSLKKKITLLEKAGYAFEIKVTEPPTHQ